MKTLTKLGLAAAMIAAPSLGLAQDGPVPGTNPSTDSVFILNSLLFLIGGFLVFFMACGFAMLEAGLVRSKNVTMQLTKNVALFGLASIFYYLIGYNLMYPLGTWSIEGVLSGVWGPGVLEAVGVTADAADDYGYASTGSDFFFQLMFCAATASIVSGTVAERVKLWPFLVFTIIVGWVAKGLIGRSLIRYGETLVDRTPFVRSIYNGAKQLAETVFAQSERSFERACLIQYPRKGVWAIGFVSTEARGEVAGKAETGSQLLSIFVPTTPNPTSGFLLFFPKEDVIELDMSIEDAAKLVISAGLVYPNGKDPTKPPAAAEAR